MTFPPTPQSSQPPPQQFNPYAAPQAPLMTPTPNMARTYVPGTVWRSGDLLVMLNGGWLPDRCVVTNDPALPDRLACTMSYIGPWYYLWPLIAIYFAGNTAGTRTRVDVPVSSGAWWGRAGRYTFAIGLGVVGFITMVGGFIATEAIGPLALVIALVGGILFFLAIGMGRTWVEPLSAHYIDHQLVWLQGASPDYLAQLPEWPHAPPPV